MTLGVSKCSQGNCQKVQFKLSPLFFLLGLCNPLNLAKASFWQLFCPSVKTDGNENKKGLFIAVPFKGRAESKALNGFSQN
jgi:hypothetical protein